MIIKRVIYLYVDDVNNKKIKISLLKILNDSSFIKISIYNYFYFELNIDKFSGVFLKTRIILKKIKVFFSLKIAHVFWRFFFKIIKKNKK